MKSIFLKISVITLIILSIGIYESKAQKVISLDSKNFAAKTKSGLVLVDFYADWCRPCKMLKPILDETAAELGKKLVIASIDTDKNKELSNNHNITGIPCLILFKDGKEITRFVGYKTKDALMKELEPYIKKTK